MAVSFYFRNFANGSERKGLSAFTVKFPSSAAGLHLVLKTSCLRKKSRLIRYRMVECFHAITIDAKRLHLGVSRTVLFFLWEINRFLETLSSFCIFEKALFLDTWDSILERFEHRVSRFELRVSTYFWAVLYMYHLGRITARCNRITRSLICNFVIYVPPLVLTSFMYSFIFTFIHISTFPWKPKRNLSILLHIYSRKTTTDSFYASEMIYKIIYIWTVEKGMKKWLIIAVIILYTI